MGFLPHNRPSDADMGRLARGLHNVWVLAQKGGPDKVRELNDSLKDVTKDDGRVADYNLATAATALFSAFGKVRDGFIPAQRIAKACREAEQHYEVAGFDSDWNRPSLYESGIIWSIIIGSALAVVLGFWSSQIGSVGEHLPVFRDFTYLPGYVAHLPFAVSRWWDIAAVPFWVFGWKAVRRSDELAYRLADSNNNLGVWNFGIGMLGFIAAIPGALVIMAALALIALVFILKAHGQMAALLGTLWFFVSLGFWYGLVPAGAGVIASVILYRLLIAVWRWIREFVIQNPNTTGSQP